MLSEESASSAAVLIDVYVGIVDWWDERCFSVMRGKLCDVDIVVMRSDAEVGE